MSGIPTEEDVLDVLTCWWLVHHVITPWGQPASKAHPDDWTVDLSWPLWETALELLGRGEREETLQAIADSERRLAVEQAERAILDAVRDGYSIRTDEWGNRDAEGRPGVFARILGGEGDRRAAERSRR